MNLAQPWLARLRSEPALSLAVLRIVVAWLILVAPGFRESARVAELNPVRWIAAEGLGWFVEYVPISRSLARVVQVVAAFSAFCAIVGMRTRLALVVLTIAAFYLFSISQLAGFVWHDMHLLWFAALLAVSPCDDVLAVDATHPWFTEGVVYAPPLLAVRLLLGFIYFFPGLHKLLRSGIEWALSDNLKYQLYWKWVQHGELPSFRIDEWPTLLRIGGLCVMTFELSFIMLVLWRRTRPLAAAAGLGFHIVSQAFFFIPFASLWLCYVALVDLRPLVRAMLRIGLRAQRVVKFLPPATAPVNDTASGITKRPHASLVYMVGSLLLVGALVQGARGQTQSYPFACYPTFEWIAPNVMPDLYIAAVDASGQETELVHARQAGYRTQRQWADIWSLAGVTHPLSAARLRAYYASIKRARPDLAAMRSVMFYRVYRSVLPEDRGRVLRRIRLLEIPQD